ncbi:alcohol-forming fatty acyl-CoA reductase-like [Nicotiana sylvestris]|uniref:alcohol-forming fatty acyl-CoA reductase-like n=1 Tax=Nicotiana sylvestris TaxID=4096 RepID=UPI00388CE5DE
MVTRRNRSSHTAIYHISSSRTNPLKSTDLMQFSAEYFKKNPWINETGTPVKVKEEKTMILKWANLILCQHLQELHTDLERRINLVIRLAELYKPYTLFKGIFNDTNAEMLQMATRESNADDTFNFDPRTIQWEKYFKEIRIPGLVKYVF